MLEAMVLRCLIVDDNPQFLAVARQLLEREGIVVVGAASNGAEAIQRAKELTPDVMLLDIDLGHESGFDIARHLAAVGGTGPRVILISTYAESDFADLIAASPAAGFLSKSDLSASAISRILERADGSAR
jgi:DNA-binding NarL/FixJ family response regulator